MCGERAAGYVMVLCRPTMVYRVGRCGWLRELRTEGQPNSARTQILLSFRGQIISDDISSRLIFLKIPLFVSAAPPCLGSEALTEWTLQKGLKSSHQPPEKTTRTRTLLLSRPGRCKVDTKEQPKRNFSQLPAPAIGAGKAVQTDQHSCLD